MDTRTLQSRVVTLVNYVLYEYDLVKHVVSVDNPNYQEWLLDRRFKGSGQLGAMLVPALKMCVALLAVRFIWFRRTREQGAGASSSSSKAAAAGQRSGGKPSVDDSLKVAESTWSIVGGSVLLGWSWYTIATSNNGCRPRLNLDLSQCYVDWPVWAAPDIARLYYAAELAWYLQLLVKHHLGMGLADELAVKVHHLVSIALIVASYWCGMARVGVFLLAVLNTSTPVLHISKTFHSTGRKTAAAITFALFALSFIVSRVVLYPIYIIPLTLVASRKWLPLPVHDMWTTYVCLNVLVVSLYFIQLLWLPKILNVLMAAKSPTGGAFDKAVAQSDIVVKNAQQQQQQQQQQMVTAVGLASQPQPQQPEQQQQ